MPNLVVEVGVAESSNQRHEALEVCAVVFVGHPCTDRVLVRSRRAIGDSFLPPAASNEVPRPLPVVRGRQFEQLGQVELPSFKLSPCTP